MRLIQKIKPDEIYNLAAQSHVRVSFESPEYTSNADGLGTLRLLEAIRILGLNSAIKFYQASTSELYGKIQASIQNEKTPFYPRSPYAVAKLYAYWITVNYREAYGIFAAMAFYLTMKVQGEARHSLLARLQWLRLGLFLGFKRNYFLGIYLLKEIGGMQRITWRVCGEFFNTKT